MLLGVLHFVPDDEEAYAIVRRLMEALPSGSYLVGPRLPAERPRTWTAAVASSGTSAAPPPSPSHARADHPLLRGDGTGRPGMVSCRSGAPSPATQYAGQEVSQYGAVGRKS